MNSNLAFKRALDAVERELVNLQLDLATRNLENALLELRYIPDQPRVPAGNPDGGQWTDGGALPGTGRLPAGTLRVAQSMGLQKFSGVLIRHDYVTSQDISRCTYYDSRANYSFTTTWSGNYCPNGHLFY